jgi:neutral ceramidase
MQGMADKDQITAGVESPLYARAFVVAQAQSATAAGRVAIVVADIWSGTSRVKDAVLQRLAALDGHPYTEENVLLAGTHTHSAPGGYSGARLYDYDFERGGCDEATVTCIADGCARAVEMAHANLGPGRIYVNRGEVTDCGGNRSEQAYLCNPQAERNQWGADTDREMLLLKFVKTDDAGQEHPVGALNWYAIHPTDRGQNNMFVTGDNKGYASQLFEHKMGTDVSQPETFVAAFANSNCGDVSGNVGVHPIPDAIDDSRARMEKHGTQQFEVADSLFQTASEEVTGAVDHRHTRVDFSNVTIEAGGGRTWPAALGVSFMAGSSEDSVPVPDLGIPEGVTDQNISLYETIIKAGAALGLSAFLGISLIDEAEAVTGRDGQLPKPVVLMPAIDNPPAVPQVLPIQLLRVGTVAVVGIPAELTTMAGRRLRMTVLTALSSLGVAHVALGTYANEYSQYVTTPEEYSSQQYEGASTLFGPHTLEAYQQVAGDLATAMAQGSQSLPGPARPEWSSPPQHRYRFRNRSNADVTLRFYHTNDALQWLTLPNGEQKIAAGAEVALPEKEFSLFRLSTLEQVRVKVSSDIHLRMAAGQLLTIAPDGSATVGDYTPPARP